MVHNSNNQIGPVVETWIILHATIQVHPWHGSIYNFKILNVCRTKDEVILVAKTHREYNKKALAQEVATVMVVEHYYKIGHHYRLHHCRILTNRQ